MGKKVDPREFLLNTDYEMDKIIYFKEGKFTASAGNLKTVQIPHNLGFAPLIFGLGSFNESFTNTRTLPLVDVNNPNGAFIFDFEATDANINIYYQDVNGRFPTTIYYRIYGFEPSDTKNKIGPTSSHAKEFILNTDYNYCKLFKKGTVAGDADTTINHNLGYIPQFLAWYEYKSLGTPTVYPVETNVWNDPLTSLPYGIAITSSKVTFKYSATGISNSKIHYRIYYDET